MAVEATPVVTATNATAASASQGTPNAQAADEKAKVQAETLIGSGKPAADAASKPASEAAPSKDSPAKTPEAKAPEEIKLPEGALIDLAFAKEIGLTQAQAEKLAARIESDRTAYLSSEQYLETQREVLKQEASTKWVQQVKDDKDLGGEAFVKNVELAKRALTKFGSPELVKALDDTGLGNHPELIRVFWKIGKADASDSIVIAGAEPGSKAKSQEEVLFPMEELQYKEPS